MPKRKEMLKALKNISHEYWYADPQDTRYGEGEAWFEDPKYVLYVLTSQGVGFLIAVSSSDGCYERIVTDSDINKSQRLNEIYPELYEYIQNDNSKYEDYYDEICDENLGVIRDYYYLSRVNSDQAGINDLYLWVPVFPACDEWVYAMEESYMYPGSINNGVSWDEMNDEELGKWHLIHQKIKAGRGTYWQITKAERQIANSINERFYFERKGW